jgi:hypothetical protein
MRCSCRFFGSLASTEQLLPVTKTGAMTQNNLGSAFFMLGQRESDIARWDFLRPADSAAALSLHARGTDGGCLAVADGGTPKRIHL